MEKAWDELSSDEHRVRPLVHDVPIGLLDAMLDTLPLEITLLDSEDTIVYFNKENRDMLLSRTRAIVGTKVQQCHSQKSVNLVNQILSDFKSGKKDCVESWFDRKGRYLHVRYFAVRDNEGKYLGCMELVQDITDIKKLEGQNKLLKSQGG